MLTLAQSFTPLGTPAVTPHENRYQIHDFNAVAPGTDFSLLTSPALEAQLEAQNHQQPQGQPGQYHPPGASIGTSPLYRDVDMLGDAAIAQPELAKRVRSTKRSTTTRNSNVAARVRQSPIVKPARRKAAVAISIPSKEVSQSVEEAQKSGPVRPPPSGLEVPRSSDSSEFDSVSPENLSDMGPPPKPGSVIHSPATFAQGTQQNDHSDCPATPASLMHLQRSPNFAVGEDDTLLEDLLLPGPSEPLTSPLDTAIDNASESTVTQMHARKTPKLTPISTPSGLAAQTGRPSPMLNAVASPTSPAFALGSGRRADPKTSRGVKKRNSVSTTLASPALRPKISPSIKPLLSERGKSAARPHSSII